LFRVFSRVSTTADVNGDNLAGRGEKKVVAVAA